MALFVPATAGPHLATQLANLPVLFLPLPLAPSSLLPPSCSPCLQGCLPATVQQFRSTASVQLDDFMENFIEQAETISFGAINVVRWTQWQLPRKQEREREKGSSLVGGLNGWACSLSVFEVFNIEAEQSTRPRTKND